MAIKNSFSHSVKNYHSLNNIFIYDDVKSLCKAANNGFEETLKMKIKMKILIFLMNNLSFTIKNI